MALQATCLTRLRQVLVHIVQGSPARAEEAVGAGLATGERSGFMDIRAIPLRNDRREGHVAVVALLALESIKEVLFESVITAGSPGIIGGVVEVDPGPVGIRRHQRHAHVKLAILPGRGELYVRQDRLLYHRFDYRRLLRRGGPGLGSSICGRRDHDF